MLKYILFVLFFDPCQVNKLLYPNNNVSFEIVTPQNINKLGHMKQPDGSWQVPGLRTHPNITQVIGNYACIIN